jgi:predicted nucleic-acid-binding Zn-ribbon protein
MLVITCKNCGYILYQGYELVGPKEIIFRNGGKCPKCGEKINSKPEKVNIIDQLKKSKLVFFKSIL